MNKILIVANDFNTVFNFRRELVTSLLQKYIVIISIPRDPRNKFFLEIGCLLEETNITRFGKNPFKELSIIFKYNKIIRKHRPNIIMTYTIKPNLYIGFLSRFKSIDFIPNITGLGSFLRPENKRSTLLLAIYKFSFKKAFHVFFQNQQNLDYFLKNKVVYNNCSLLPGSGINLCKYQYSPVYQFSPIKFVTVSRLRKDKGIDELFSAILQIIEFNPNCEFHIIGGVEEKKYYGAIDEITKSGKVFYYGELPKNEVADIVSNATCLIHPSHHEGMSNAILEASALGRPAIASNISGCKEIVLDGITGFTFQVKDHISLVSKIHNFISMSKEDIIRLGESARKHVEQNFNSDIIINAYIKKIEEKLNEKHV